MLSEMKIYKYVGQFFFGCLVTIAIFGTLTPNYLMEPINLLPPTTKFLLLTSTFVYGIMAFALWQVGYFTSEFLFYVYRKIHSQSTKEDGK